MLEICENLNGIYVATATVVLIYLHFLLRRSFVNTISLSLSHGHDGTSQELCETWLRMEFDAGAECLDCLWRL